MTSPSSKRTFFDFDGEHLNHVAFPMGGIGAGMICLEGTGAFSHISLRHKPDVFNEPMMFSALFVKGAPTARVLEGPVPKRKAFGYKDAALGMADRSYGLPRFRECSFSARFPFATVELADPDMPVTVAATGWSPFVPGDADSSSLPVLAVEYRLRNVSSRPIDAVFSFHSVNFISVASNTGAYVRPVKGGFVLVQPPVDGQLDSQATFAAFVDDSGTRSDCAWFRGGFYDPLTALWDKVQSGSADARPPQEDVPGKGGSLYMPFALEAGEERVVRLQFAWYVPRSTLNVGVPLNLDGADFISDGWQVSKPLPPQSVVAAPYHGLSEDLNWIPVPAAGQFIDVHDLRGPKGVVYLARRMRFPSACKRMLRIGHDGGVRVFVDGKAVAVTAGTINPAPVTRTEVNLDFSAGEHELCVALDRADGFGFGIFASLKNCDADCSMKSDESADNYIPWYAGRFTDIDAVVAYWRNNYDALHAATAKFSDCFHDTTLPQELVEAVAANLSILKSPTCLRQTDNRFWGWEGCCDSNGSCHGSCTHVWNYAQALPHLFPALERSLRETEFNVSQDERGHQNFRTPLPIQPPTHDFHAAADGQLGGIMKVHREWRISGDTAWLKSLWPKLRQSLEYCIATWDPDHRGMITEPHHNTYDIEFWGSDGMCTSFYLGALIAAIAIGKAVGDDVSDYEKLLATGRKNLDSELWNGEWFFQKIQWKGLRAEVPRKLRDTPEAEALLEKEGPKYQYGGGCLSDGVLGDWIARCCGVEPPLNPDKTRKHLESVFKYNFKPDLSSHSNPQRPTYAFGGEAGLLLCSWPRGGKPSLPFVYSDEVWTGIEYQVASHLIMLGKVKEGLDIVHGVRSRYDGRCRNPFDEYECGHWYARAMSSYGLLQAYSGVRYDAITRTLFIQPAVKGDFRAFLSTADGYGVVGIKDGRPFMEVRSGSIPVKRIERS